MSFTREANIVRLCAATTNSSSEDPTSTSTTTTDEFDDANHPTYMYEYWSRTKASSPPGQFHDDTDHTSLVVEASSSSKSTGDLPRGRTMASGFPDYLTLAKSSEQHVHAHYAVSIEGSTSETCRTKPKVETGDSKMPCKDKVSSKGGYKSSRLEISSSSSDQMEILNNLQAELEETRATLELTEKQLTLKMDENDEAADQISKAWSQVRELHTEGNADSILMGHEHSGLLLHIFQQIELEGGPVRAWLTQEGLQRAIIHLHAAKEDAECAKKLAKDEVKVISKRCDLLQRKLRGLTASLQTLLGKPVCNDASKIDSARRGDEDNSERAVETDELCFSLLEDVKRKLHCQDQQITRWQMTTGQLRCELELSRQRCTAKMDDLRRVREQCRSSNDETEAERCKVSKQDELIRELNAKVEKLEEQLKIAKTTCCELWEQHEIMSSDLSAKNAELDKIHAKSSSVPLVRGDSPIVSSDALQDIHEQFNTHMLLAAELETEHQKVYELRNTSLASMEAVCMNEKVQLSKQRGALKTGLKQQEVIQQQLSQDRKSQEERIQKMTESLLEVTTAKSHLTSSLSTTQEEAEFIRRQLVATSTALEYEQQAKDLIQVKCDRAEEQKVKLQHELCTLKHNHQLISQKWDETWKQNADLLAKLERCKDEHTRMSSELEEAKADLQTLQYKTSITMATIELENNAKLTEGAILNSDLGRKLGDLTIERDELTKRVHELEGIQMEYDQLKQDLETAKSLCDRLQPQVDELQTDLATSLKNLQEITDEKQQQEKHVENLQEELDNARLRQVILRKKLKRQRACSDRTIKDLTKERDVLTNQIAEAMKNLTNIEQRLKATLNDKLHVDDDKQNLTATCALLQEQKQEDTEERQRAVCKAENLTQQLEQERMINNECQEHLTGLVTKLASMETMLKEERLKISTLSAELFDLRDTTRSQKTQIAQLTQETQELQLDFQSSNHKYELQYNKLVGSAEKTMSRLDKTCENQSQELKKVCKENHRMETELNLLNNSLAKKRADYSQALLAIYKAELKEKEMLRINHELEGQLDVEKSVQDELNKSWECQEAELQRLRKVEMKSKNRHIQEQQNSMESATKIELQHIKAELSREIFSRIESSRPKQNKNNSEKSKVYELQAQLSKLEGLRAVDKLTIASLTEDLQRLRKHLAKQKDALLHQKYTSKPCKEDIKTALAKAHVRALSISMTDDLQTAESPVFNNMSDLFHTNSFSKKTPDYTCWETKSSDSNTSSSDEYSS